LNVYPGPIGLVPFYSGLKSDPFISFKEDKI
jgi:hypothetical protein